MVVIYCDFKVGRPHKQATDVVNPVKYADAAINDIQFSDKFSHKIAGHNV
jgi:hypothetical protein